MESSFLEECKSCSAYIQQIKTNGTKLCPVSKENRPICPCIKCLIITMCDVSCDDFRFLRSNPIGYAAELKNKSKQRMLRM
jgi:hypothetical protein